jgi:hypothetical protein
MSALKPADIIAWFRSKSREYAQQAAKLERDFGMDKKDMSLSNDANANDSDGAEKAPLDPIVKYLTEFNAKRPADIAEHLKTTKDAVLATIDAHPKLFTRAERGWIKLTERKGATS